MPDIELFDVQCGFGGAVPGVEKIVSADELVSEMLRLRIKRALVRIVPEQLDMDFEMTNSRLFASCSGKKRLLPCPVVVPSSAHDLPPEPEVIDALIRRGARAVWIRPDHDSWSLAPWCSAKLFQALSGRKMPVLLLNRMVGCDKAAELAQAYPELPFIMEEVDYRHFRILFPLVENYPNIHLSIGSNFTIHCGISRIAEKLGARQLLFGTGFPSVDPMPAVAGLMYAPVSQEVKQLIGHGNLERILGEVS